MHGVSDAAAAACNRGDSAVTPTEKKYLLFLSPRTPRPKSCDRPRPATLRNMEEMGWIAFGPRPKIGVQSIYITPAGEAALDALEDAAGVERGRVVWRKAASMPEGQHVLVTDGQVVKVGLREDDVLMVPGYPATSVGMWTHWAAFPRPPLAAMEVESDDR